MRHLPLLIGLTALAACAPHYRWVEDPDDPPPAAESTEELPASDLEDAKRQRPACDGTTRASRLLHRKSRYNSVDSFNSRNCVPAPGDP